MRRLGPRPLAVALAEFASDAAPASTLASVQGCWLEVAGPQVAVEAWPVVEHAGVVTISCRSAVWAQELGLLSEDLLARLNGAIADGPAARPLVQLRFDSRGIVPK
ncbi:MAG: DUF721 domain-containing protein [Thermoleophilaceae bacterium]|jgi:predicted nucleic acid-binding Zn ribbon protein|nr:DUF721 domain-containing protein [Thermoleophilaceae bacterium]